MADGILTLRYEEDKFYDLAVEAIERNESFNVAIKGVRSGIIKRARPLSWLLFDNPEQPIKSNRPTILRLFLSYLLLSPTFWGVRFLATQTGMKENWVEERGLLTVSFIAQPNPTTPSPGGQR
jgi:hypothetical protein